MLLISFAVRIRWRSGTSLSPAHVLPIFLLSHVHVHDLRLFLLIRRFPANQTTYPYKFLRFLPSLQRYTCKMSLRRRFETIFSVQSSFIAHSWYQRTKMLSFPIAVFCISFLLNFSNTFTFLSFKPTSHPTFMSGSYNIYFSRA